MVVTHEHTADDRVDESARVRQATDALWSAVRTASTLAPVRDLLSDDLDSAYAVQDLVVQRRVGATNPRIGRKVGLTSEAVQRQLGVDQPDFGVLLRDMRLDEADLIPVSRLIAPRIEAEVAFVLHRDLDATDRASVLDAVAWVAPALEIVDSRIENWDIGIVDTVADNASSAYFVLGSNRVRPGDVTPRDVVMTLHRDDQPVSSGTGRDCLGDPVAALVWVAETAARLGRPLLAGEIVLSGALGPMVGVGAGQRFTAELTGLGSVSITAAGGLS